MNNFIFGTYIPGTSFVHRMNPASKFLLSIFFIALTLIGNNWTYYLILFGLALVSTWATRISFKVIYHGIKPLLFIIVLTAIVQLLFDPRGLILLKMGPIAITKGGLYSSGMVFFRFLLIIIISTILTLSTPSIELANGIRIILSPLSYLKIPVNVISLMISMALRFIPTLYRELKIIIKAQQARGVIFRSGLLMKRMKRIAALIVPLLFSSFERARKLSYAMLSRGYQTNKSRTQLRQSHVSYRDVFAWIMYLVFGVVEIMVRR